MQLTGIRSGCFSRILPASACLMSMERIEYNLLYKLLLVTGRPMRAQALTMWFFLLVLPLHFRHCRSSSSLYLARRLVK